MIDMLSLEYRALRTLPWVILYTWTVVLEAQTSTLHSLHSHVTMISDGCAQDPNPRVTGWAQTQAELLGNNHWRMQKPQQQIPR